MGYLAMIAKYIGNAKDDMGFGAIHNLSSLKERDIRNNGKYFHLVLIQTLTGFSCILLQMSLFYDVHIPSYCALSGITVNLSFGDK